MRKILSVLVLVAGFTASAQAQIVKVQSTWRKCNGASCSTFHDYATGAIVGKWNECSLVLTCKHVCTGRPGEEFQKLTVADKPARGLRLSEEDDIALLWVQADLGEPMQISKEDAAVGGSLTAHGLTGKGKGTLSTIQGKQTREGVLAVANTEHSGAPVVNDKNVIYGVCWGATKPTSTRTGWTSAETHFVPASRIVRLAHHPRPIGGITFYDPFSVLCPPQPRSSPAFVYPPNVITIPPARVRVIPAPESIIQIPPPDIRVPAPVEIDPLGRHGALLARLRLLEGRFFSLHQRVRRLEELGSQGDPDQTHAEILQRLLELEGRAQQLDARIRVLETLPGAQNPAAILSVRQ